MELDEVIEKIAQVLRTEEVPAMEVWDTIQVWMRQNISPEQAHELTELLTRLVIAVRQQQGAEIRTQMTIDAEEYGFYDVKEEKSGGQEGPDPSLPPQGREAPEG